MSQITTSDEWRAMLAGEPANMLLGPWPGYYRTKMCKGGPWVATRVWLDEWRETRCRIGPFEILPDDLATRWPFFEAVKPSDWQALEKARQTDPRMQRIFQPVDLTDGELLP